MRRGFMFFVACGATDTVAVGGVKERAARAFFFARTFTSVQLKAVEHQFVENIASRQARKGQVFARQVLLRPGYLASF